MKMMKKFALLTVALLLLTMALAGCGGSGESASAVDADGNVEYRVVLTDALGNAYHEGIIVKFLQGGQEMAMQVVDATGVAAKAMPAGEYTVELVYTSSDASYSYDADALTLTAAEPELKIMMSRVIPLESETLYVESEEHQAFRVGIGCTRVVLQEGKRSYFLFAPEQAGNYEFGVEGNAAAIGYYGAPHFVQTQSAVDVVENKVQVSVSTGNLGGTLVIGLDGDGADSCTLTIERIGEPVKTLADEPWHVYQTTVELSPYTLPAGASLREFDVKAASDAYTLVLNETDGFYHLDTANGPLVLVRLAGEMEYLDCYKTILEHTGVVKYFYDENGEFVKKEQYTDCLLEYIPNADENEGVYPLTEDLKYIIQSSGEHSGWWDLEGHGYIFRDEGGNLVTGINADIAWLFMCCYIG